MAGKQISWKPRSRTGGRPCFSRRPGRGRAEKGLPCHDRGPVEQHAGPDRTGAQIEPAESKAEDRHRSEKTGIEHDHSPVRTEDQGLGGCQRTKRRTDKASRQAVPACPARAGAGRGRPFPRPAPGRRARQGRGAAAGLAGRSSPDRSVRPRRRARRRAAATMRLRSPDAAGDTRRQSKRGADNSQAAGRNDLPLLTFADLTY